MALRRDVLTWVAVGLAVAGIVWLAPLMLDQMTFFGDREQEADAAAARSLMAWPALLVAAGAALLATRGRSLHAALAAVPLVSVVLAWTTPDALYQLLAYGITAPIGLGALLAASMPMDVRLHRPLVTAIVLVTAFFAITSTPFAAVLGALMLLSWWGLSRAHRR